MSHNEDGADPEVGTLAEETAKLLGALNGWAREQGSGLGASVSDLTEHATAATRGVDAHLATGAAECTMCPVCRAVHAARSLSPEVKIHLASAAASLMHAAAAVLATAVPPEGSGGRGGVEHIDLDDLDEPGGWPGEERS